LFYSLLYDCKGIGKDIISSPDLWQLEMIKNNVSTERNELIKTVFW